MRKNRFFYLLLLVLVPILSLNAQDRMTPELLWKLGRVSALGVTEDGQKLIYQATYPDVQTNTSSKKWFSVPISGGPSTELSSIDGLLAEDHVSTDGQYKVTHKAVKLDAVSGVELYPKWKQSNVRIYESLHYRHWDTWMNGTYNHVFLHKKTEDGWDDGIDIMKGQAFHTPTMPFGGTEDYLISKDGKYVVYVTKQLSGTEYVQSTNTDIFRYDIESGQTVNLSADNPGYDTQPAYSPDGSNLAWLSMARDGYESDKNDLIVSNGETKQNLTAAWDGTVNGFAWSTNGQKIYFTAPTDGTVQLFEVDYPGLTKKMPVVKQLTNGVFDISGIVKVMNDRIIVYRNDMNTAREIYAVNPQNGEQIKLSMVNDAIYANIKKSKIEKRMMQTTDGEEMLTWVIYPPDFDPNKKYPTLLYCQGGPQGALSQFYSFRWNFQLMAAQGYIVVAPNRRGMPGHGVEWNEQISKDWGGQAMDDYLTAIDEMAKEPFVDNDRLGAVGASYGGYSVFYLAGIHENRFKSFIAHAGVFNLQSMYGTTEELFFVNWDMGGPYWEKDNKAAQKTYNQFNPANLVDRWNTPMLVIHGGKDFRVPESQGFEAFQVLQIKGIKSKLLYFPDENHWILNGQNAQIWHAEFFKWLKETL